MPDLNDDSLQKLLGDDPITTSVGVRIRQDEQTLTNLERRFKSIKQEAEGIARALKEAGISAQKLGAASVGTPGTSGAGQIGSTPVAGGLITPTSMGKTRVIDRITSTFGGGVPGGGGGGPGGPGGNLPSISASAASFTNQAVNAGIQAINARVDRGRDYALSADRMTMLYQQMKGMSQVAIQNTYRQPLTNYKLGAGGINTMLGLEATTGLRASTYAPGVEALRIQSGFSLSNQSAASMLEQLSAPETVNRMFMMTGTSLIGPGGRQNDIMSVMQSLVKRAGLTNPSIMKSAMLKGSVTRANLNSMGVTGDFQDQLLQYAQSNLSYKNLGGKGMYNPGSKEAQKLMGIDKNFAMQAEETDRLRGKRDEEFYSRQADNFADLEKQTQRLVNVMAKLEDVLSPLIGAQTSNRVAGQLAAGIGTAAGAFIGSAIPGVGTLAGAAAGNLLGRGVGWLVGNAVMGDIMPDSGGFSGTTSSTTSGAIWGSKTQTPSPYIAAPKTTSTAPATGGLRMLGPALPSGGFKTGSKAAPKVSPLAAMNRFRKILDEAIYMSDEGNRLETFGAFTKVLWGKDEMTLNEFKRQPPFLGMNPEMQAIFTKASIEANRQGTIIGMGSGYRTYDEQKALFLDRYMPSADGTGVEWEGQRWVKKNPDDADAAPPGAGYSNHEHGLAFDAVGDITWLQNNAKAFGLENFANVNEEPWHFQLAGLKGRPGGGAAYNEEVGWKPLGIAYDEDGVGYASNVSEKDIIQTLYDAGLKTVKWTRDVNGTQKEIGIDYVPVRGGGVQKAGQQRAIDSLLKSRPSGSADSMERWLTGGAAKGKAPTGGVQGVVQGASKQYGALSMEQAAQMLYDAGFRGDDLVHALAIMWRESSGDPSVINDSYLEFNPDGTRKGNDVSYGLFQHNFNPDIMDTAGNVRDWQLSGSAEDWANGLGQDLYDPVRNIALAFERFMWDRNHGGTGWGPWVNDGVSHLYGAEDFVQPAMAAATSVGVYGIGDYVPQGAKNEGSRSRGRGDVGRRDGYTPSPSSMGMMMMSPQGAMAAGISQPPVINGGNTITISPTVNITNSGATLDQDLEGMARKVAAMLEREINRATLRRT